MSGSTLESSSGHLHILNHGNERQFLDLQNSVIASHRLRLFPAGFSKASIGAKVSLGFIPPEIPCNIIVGKFVGATGQEFGLIAKQLLRNLEHARSQSSKIFVDYTDHHLSLNNHFSIFYTDIFQIADQIIVTNETLHAALTQTYGYQKK